MSQINYWDLFWHYIEYVWFAPSATGERVEGLQKDPKGPDGLMGPLALRRSQKEVCGVPVTPSYYII